MGSEWFSPFFSHFSPFSTQFSPFSTHFSPFSAHFSPFSPKGQGQTTAIYCKKMGNFTPTPSAPTPCKTSRSETPSIPRSEHDLTTGRWGNQHVKGSAKNLRCTSQRNSCPRGPNDQKNLIPIEIFDLDRNFWSRSKISISTSRFPHKK